MKKFALISLALLAFVPAAMADLTAVGPAVPSHSWGQGFNESGVGLFDKVVFQIDEVDGGFFEVQANRNLPDGWSTVYENGVAGGKSTLAIAAGPARSDMTWNVEFWGNQSSPVDFDFWALRNGAVVDAAEANWNGSSWSITASTEVPPPVPVPAAVILGAMGLGLVGWTKKRMA